MNKKIIIKTCAVLTITLLFIGTNLVPAAQLIKNDQIKSLWEYNILNEKTDFDRRITFLMKLGHIPALSTCIIKNNSMAWSKSYGFYDIKNNKEASDQTIYLAGSISKTVTATALLQLYENGQVGLDDDASEYLPFNLKNPNFPDEPITIRMLLAHQSSLGESIFTLVKHFFFINYSYDWLEEYVTPGGCIYDPKIWGDFPPGERFEYSNIGFELLGYIIERITHQTLERYCEENIFKPLGMTKTSFHVSNFDVEYLAVPYIWRIGFYFPMPHYDVGISAASGILTTITDLSCFLIAHMNGGVYNKTRILKEDTINLMHTIHYSSDSEYGLGWMMWEGNDGNTYQGHIGSVFGGFSSMFFSSNDDFGVIFFCNEHKIFGIKPHFLEQQAYIGIQLVLIAKANQL